MSKQDVISTIAFLCDQYNVDQSESQIAFWIEALAEYPAEVLRRAAVAHVKKSKWMPKVAELLELCNHDREQAFGKQSGATLWDQAMQLFNASLRGEITEEQLYASKEWKWYERNRTLVEDSANPVS